MRLLSQSLVAVAIFACAALVHAGAARDLRMGADDVFRVAENPQWSISFEKEVPFRLADVKITSKSGYPFSMMLYFKVDTPDLAKFDTPEKIAKVVRTSSEPYLPVSVEKKIELQSVPVSYGSFTVLTDADVVKRATIPPGEFKYLTRGMVRLSKDSVLGFSLMSNDVTSPDYKSLMDHVFGFVKTSGKPIASAPQAGPIAAAKAESHSDPSPIRPAETSTAYPRKARTNSDMRKCLTLDSNAEVMKCAGAR